MMKSSKLFLFTLILFTTGLTGQTPYTVKHVKMTVSGTSTLHDWESKVENVTAKGNITVTENTITAIQDFSATIVVKSIISTKGKVMDKKTWEALKAEQNPRITYQLSSVNNIKKSGDEILLQTSGKLNIAGVTKELIMEVKAKMLADGSIQFSGSKDIKLADYNMERPTALMGTIKVGETVTVKFSTTLAPAIN